MQAIILAGGLGTRLREVVNDRPKPMALVNDKPFLEYIIENLRKYNIKDIILAIGYMYEIIQQYFGDGSKFGVNIKYSIEKKQLGTAGAIKNTESLITSEEIIVLNGDTLFDIDYLELFKMHKQKKAMVSIALRKVEDPKRYGAVEIDKQNKIINFIEKSEEPSSKYINGGIYIINRDVLSLIERNLKVSLENEIIPKILKQNKLFGMCFDRYFIDIGLPEDYYKFQQDV